MTEQITAPRATWDALREALEEYLNKDNVELQLNGIKSKAIEALTAANAVSNQDLPIGKCGVLSKSEPQAQRELEEWLDANRMQAIGSLHHELVARFTAHPQATEPAPKNLIGWRTADYLRETTDRHTARNWEVHYEVLPIFEGDANTKLAAAPEAKQ